MKQRIVPAHRRFVFPASALAVFLSGQALSADAEGRLAFNNHCRTCHVLRDGDNRAGPSLHRILGRKAGTAVDYRYSRSLSQSDFIWDAASLDAFIEAPDTVVPGHGMRPYGGLPDSAVRAAIVRYLVAQ